MGSLILMKGMLIGFAIAIPVGPIAVICVKKTLDEGHFHGFISGLGAAVADTLYGIMAAFGLTFVSGFVERNKIWISLVGGLFLIGHGISDLLKGSKKKINAVPDHFGAFSSSFFLAFANPLTLFAFAAVFSSVGILGVGKHVTSAITLVVGIFCGSALWWLLLTGLATLFRGKLSHTNLIWVQKVSSIIIILFGLLVLSSMRYKLF